MYTKNINGEQVFSSCRTIRMDDGSCVSNFTAEQISLAGWTYSNLTNGSASAGQFYYDRETRRYYAIVKGTHKTGSTTYYHAEIGQSLNGDELPGGPWYLTDSGISTSYSPEYEKQATGAILYFPRIILSKRNMTTTEMLLRRSMMWGGALGFLVGL